MRAMLGGKLELHTSQLIKKLMKPIRTGKVLELSNAGAFNYEPY